eukprot:TRINITY_DN29074_c0_g1_i1.p1 TRINITY_DN29074_c0_g1~~TRINITY_DN29074_c0_g1_i1.p1  ORF type:complete len:216 (-),score=41.00 TRINITY_DN29074_c0_g1_i1:388-1035(-)
MGDCRQYEICLNAYAKIVLHAVKHKSSAVNGILVGKLHKTTDQDNAEKVESVEITEAVPLSHGQLGLLPTFEIALMQVEEHFASKSEGLGVVGYYHANECYDDCELNALAKKIGDHIARYCPQAAICLLDNKLLEEFSKGESKKPVVQLYVRDSSKVWRQAGVSGTSGMHFGFKDPRSNTILLDYITEGKEQDVIDFDEHLNDISKNWISNGVFS